MKPRTVLVVPCSASQGDPGRGDVLLPKDEPGFTKPHVIAYATLVMPVLKSALNAAGYRGQLSDTTLGVLMATVARNLGIGAVITPQGRR